MSDDTQMEFNPLLMQLVISLQTATMMEMGKLMNPQTQRAERRLPMAKNSIDMLAMLKEKMAGNLADAEEKYLDQVLYDLRMNYLEESERPDPESESTTEERKDGGSPSDTDTEETESAKEVSGNGDEHSVNK